MGGLIYGPNGEPVSSSSPVFAAPDYVANNNWLQWTIEFVEGLQNPNRILLDDFEKMGKDDQVSSGMDYLKRSILRGLGDYTHEVEAVELDMRLQLERMDGNFIRSCGEILKALEFGFSVTEILWSLRGGDLALTGLQTLHPKSITLDIHKSGPLKNRLKWIRQWWRNGNYEAEIPIHKAILYTHGGEFGQLYGTSRLEKAWPLWKAKQILLKAYLITLERYGCPLSLGKIQGTPDELVRDESGKTIKMGTYMAKVLDSLSVKGSAVIPAGVEVEIIKHQGGALGKDFLECLEWLNRQIHLAIGLPALITGQGSVGSYSLGQQHSANFDHIKEQISDELTEALLEQLVRPYLDYTYGPMDNYGLFLSDQFDPDVAKKLADLAKVLLDTGIADLDRLSDVNRFRSQQGLELWDEADLQQAMERAALNGPGMMPPIFQPGPSSGAGLNPDAHGVSFGAKQRNRQRAQRELFRRLMRKAA